MAHGPKPTRLFTIEQAIHNWVWKDAPADLTVEALSDPATWAHVVGQLIPGAHVTIQPEGLPWEAEVIVLSAGVGFAKTRLVRQTMLNEASGVPDGVYVKWNGPTHKYAVYRTADDVILHKGCAAIAEAEQWARTHVTAMAA